MNVRPTPLKGVSVVEPKVIEDQRGVFYRAFCDTELDSVLRGRTIRQINVSLTRKVGAVRGFHYQTSPHAEMKLIRCLRGRVWDVALDLREGSSTFLKWYAEELSPETALMMVVPEGCAHGFQVLESDSELLYLHTSAYSPAAEQGVRYDDPAIAVLWPIDVTDISPRDTKHKALGCGFGGIRL